MTRTGLVLGAGGIVGQAFHAGVLAALEQESAGIPVAPRSSSARQPAPSPARRFGWGSRRPTWRRGPTGRSVSRAGRGLLRRRRRRRRRPARPRPRRTSLSGWRLPSPALLARTIRRPWAAPAERHRQHPAARRALRPARAHRGARPARSRLAAPASGSAPPGRTTAGGSCSVDAGSPFARLSEAVAASCAIPATSRRCRSASTAVRRRRGPLRHQRRRPRARRPRRRDRRVADVGRPRHEPRGRRRHALGDAPPPRARDPPAAGARHRGRPLRAERGHPRRSWA